ncbi:MAG: hypothetical protein V9G15_15115 [Dermatophilaceae bacterium]
MKAASWMPAYAMTDIPPMEWPAMMSGPSGVVASITSARSSPKNAHAGLVVLAHGGLAVAALVVDDHADRTLVEELVDDPVPTRLVQAPAVGHHNGRCILRKRLRREDLPRKEAGAIGHWNPVYAAGHLASVRGDHAFVSARPVNSSIV